MKGFVKFVSIAMFGIFCFIGGVAKGSGENHAAPYCVIVGAMVLLNGYAAVLELETKGRIEGNRKKTTSSRRKPK